MRIVAWEYRLPTDAVRRWTFIAFHDALSTLTEARYGVVRARTEQHNAAVQEFKKALPR